MINGRDNSLSFQNHDDTSCGSLFVSSFEFQFDSGFHYGFFLFDINFVREGDLVWEDDLFPSSNDIRVPSRDGR